MVGLSENINFQDQLGLQAMPSLYLTHTHTHTHIPSLSLSPSPSPSPCPPPPLPLSLSLSVYNTLLPHFRTSSKPMDLNRNQLVIIYNRAKMVECSENIINFPDQQLLVYFCTLLAGRFLLLQFHTYSKLVD